VHLASNTIKEEKKVFKSSKKYTQMCVRFSEKFPIDNVILAKNEYCRDITFDVLNNGSPWVDTTITELDYKWRKCKYRCIRIDE